MILTSPVNLSAQVMDWIIGLWILPIVSYLFIGMMTTWHYGMDEVSLATEDAIHGRCRVW